MAYVLYVTVESSNGTRSTLWRCYWDEGSGRPATLEEARGIDRAARGHYVEAEGGSGLRDQGWVTTREGLWICPTHAVECQQ